MLRKQNVPDQNDGVVNNNILSKVIDSTTKVTPFFMLFDRLLKYL